MDKIVRTRRMQNAARVLTKPCEQSVVEKVKAKTEQPDRTTADGQHRVPNRPRCRRMPNGPEPKQSPTAPERTPIEGNGEADASRDRALKDAKEPIGAASALETKLAIVLDMRVEGRTQAQVAEHFGVTERTARRWEQEAKRRGISPLRDRDPFEFTRESLGDLAEFRADLLALYRKARDAGDYESMAKWQKILTDVRRELDRTLELAGHINYGFPASLDLAKERARKRIERNTV